MPTCINLVKGFFKLISRIINCNTFFLKISLKVDVSEVQHCPDRGLDKLQFYLERSEADQNAPQFSGNITVPIDLDEEVKV